MLDHFTDDKSDGSKEAASVVSISTTRKDVATQMSPDGSAFSSPKEALSSPSPASAPAIVEPESHFSKIEVRDVQVDNHVTLTIARGSDSQSASITEWKKTIEANTTWEVTETAKSISRLYHVFLLMCPANFYGSLTFYTWKLF